MRRSELLSRVTAGEHWDVIIIGAMALNYALVTGIVGQNSKATGAQTERVQPQAEQLEAVAIGQA